MHRDFEAYLFILFSLVDANTQMPQVHLRAVNPVHVHSGRKGTAYAGFSVDCESSLQPYSRKTFFSSSVAAKVDQKS